MKHYKYSDQMEVGDFPPEGDMGWLWFKPMEPEPVREAWLSDKSGYCGYCDVTHRVASTVPRPKCWCCGRFTKKPVKYDYGKAYARMAPMPPASSS